MAAVPGAWALPFVIFGLRFCGQGMLSHTASVGLGRWFARSRGRANALIHIGFLSGESLLPFAFVILMGWIGWRWSWGVAALIVLMFIPILRLLLSQERKPGGEIDEKNEPGMFGKHWSRREAITHWLFWIAALTVVSPSMFGTAYFFHQVHLTEIKGWALASFVALIPLYSLVSLASTFFFGALADRFGTARIFPIAMLPGGVAFAIVSQGDSLWMAPGIGSGDCDINHGIWFSNWSGNYRVFDRFRCGFSSAIALDVDLLRCFGSDFGDLLRKGADLSAAIGC